METIVGSWLLSNSINLVVDALVVIIILSWRKRIADAVSVGIFYSSLDDDEKIMTTKMVYTKKEVDDIKEATVLAVVHDRKEFCSQMHRDYLQRIEAYEHFSTKDNIGLIVDKIETAINYLTKEIQALREDIKGIYERLNGKDGKK